MSIPPDGVQTLVVVVVVMKQRLLDLDVTLMSLTWALDVMEVNGVEEGHNASH